jgi:hypothetical protein
MSVSDILGPQFPGSPYVAKAKIRWDDKKLYIGAYLEDHQIQTTHNTNSIDS